MKSLLLSLAIFSLAPLCSAAPCTSGTLANYISLGAGGCTIGSSLISNFGIDSGSFPTSAIDATAVLINPFGGSASPGLTFSTSLTATTPAGFCAVDRAGIDLQLPDLGQFLHELGHNLS